MRPENRALLGAGLAFDAAGALVPGLGIADVAGWNPAERKLYRAMEQQRSRMALALLSDAGYDLRQAPEVWRLLTPKHLPGDLNTLKYPEQSAYQCEIIRLLYEKPAPASGAVSELRRTLP